MKLSGTVGVAVCGALVFASVAAAQPPIRRAPGSGGDDKVGVSVALQVGGAPYQFAGRASCSHEPRGYIYGVAAKLWRIEQSDGRRSVTLTLWQPASGSAGMFSLHVTSGGKSYETSTVTGKDAGPARGSGSVTFAPTGKGGTFSVSATATNGAKISGAITCDGFAAVIAEGGN